MKSLLRRELLACGLLVAAFTFAGPHSLYAQPARSAAGGLNTIRYPDERARLLQPDQRQAFPRLGSRFEVLAPSNPVYNCIANSVAVRNVWINPQPGPSDNPLRGMDRLYAPYGYARVNGQNFQLERGKRKLVVYATSHNGTMVRITHAALQLADGTWESKLGKLSRIRHLSPFDLVGPSYGRPVAVYAAPSRRLP